MLRTTQLHAYHVDHAKLTEFAGYEMPVWYSSTTEEHLAVRNHSGIFDVSHMGRFEVSGKAAAGFLEGLVPSSVGTQLQGKAFYTLLLNDRAGIIDDLIIMRLEEERYVVVVNAANAEIDMNHMTSSAPSSGLEVNDITSTSAMIAVQGPEAQASLQPITSSDLSQLKRFRCMETSVLGTPSIVSRTGYTGEDGFEVIALGPTNDEPRQALRIWEKLAQSSVPCGLSSRDSLRLEAGFPLHGSDIDQDTDPFQADLAWVISSGKEGYVGAPAVAELRTNPPQTIRRGVVLNQGIPRHGFEVFGPDGSAGVVTSGTFSPVLHQGIALAKVRAGTSEFGSEVEVAVRGTKQPGRIVKPPFYDESVYGWKRASKKGN